jgi:N-acetylglucosamine-6-sulfatase
MDGRSLMPLVRSAKVGTARDLVIERGPAGGKGKKGKKGRKAGKAGDQQFVALRTARYLYAEYVNGEKELYDLARDPHELTNRAADPGLAPVRDDLARRLARLRACAGASCR